MNRIQPEWEIRAAKPSDMESVEAIASATIHRRFDGIESWNSRTSEYPHLSLVAERGDRLLGWILGWPDRQDDDTRLRFNVMVDVAFAGLNLYRILIKALEDQSKSEGAGQLRIGLFDSEDQLLAALQDEGFAEDHRMIFSRLALTKANVERAYAGLTRCMNEGFDFSESPLQGPDQPEFWQRLSAIHNTVMLSGAGDYDDPSPQFPIESVQVFIGGGQFPGLSGRMFVAYRGQDLVGYATVYQEGAILHHGFTGVAPAFQRRGIALGLKALIFRYAQQQGVEYVDTGNRGDNLPVVSLNQGLGYTTEKVELHMWKRIKPLAEFLPEGPEKVAR